MLHHRTVKVYSWTCCTPRSFAIRERGGWVSRGVDWTLACRAADGSTGKFLCHGVVLETLLTECGQWRDRPHTSPPATAAGSGYGYVLFFNFYPSACSSNNFLLDSLKQGNLILSLQVFPIRDSSAHRPRTNLEAFKQMTPAKWFTLTRSKPGGALHKWQGDRRARSCSPRPME